MVDHSKIATDATPASEDHLRRNLTNRHIQLIAIGGAIGTGLFMGSGKTISRRPVDHFRVHDHRLYAVLRDARHGRAAAVNLEYKSFSDFAADLLGPWAGFFTGWTYWFCWVVTGIADVVAITTYAQFWFPELSQWIASLLCVLLLLGLNRRR